MRTTLSSTAIASMFAQETDEVYIMLLTISHERLSTPLRVCSDSADITSRGNLFVAYPFEFLLPSDEEGSPPVSSIAIDNVDRDIVDSLRQIDSPASFLIEIIRFDEPNTVEISWDDFQLRKVNGDLFQVTGELSIEDIILEPYPYEAFTPAKFRGLFA